MKIQILFLAVLGLACGKSLPPDSLKHDLKEFLTLLPSDKLFEVVLDYLHHDEEVKEFVVYLQSEEFPHIHRFIEYLREHTEEKLPCFKFFDEHGFDVYEIVHHVHHLLHLHPYEPKHRPSMGVGIHGLYEEVISLLPLKELKALYEEKKESREYLKTVIEYIHSHPFKSLMEHMRNWPEYHELHEIHREKFVNVHHIHELLTHLYWRGIHMLEHELKELIPHNPTAKVLDILLDYLTHDPEMKEFIVHIQSEEFPNIHKIVEYLKKYKELYMPCLKHIDEHGVDVHAVVHGMYPIISEIHVILGLHPLEPTHSTRMGVGLTGLIEDILSVLPLHELKVHIEKKVETNEYYKMLHEAIHSPEFMKMLHTLRHLPEYHELVEFHRKIHVEHMEHHRNH